MASVTRSVVVFLLIISSVSIGAMDENSTVNLKAQLLQAVTSQENLEDSFAVIHHCLESDPELVNFRWSGVLLLDSIKDAVQDSFQADDATMSKHYQRVIELFAACAQKYNIQLHPEDNQQGGLKGLEILQQHAITKECQGVSSTALPFSFSNTWYTMPRWSRYAIALVGGAIALGQLSITCL